MRSFASTRKRNTEQPPSGKRSTRDGNHTSAVVDDSGNTKASAVHTMAEASNRSQRVQSELQLARSLNGGPHVAAQRKVAEVLLARNGSAQMMPSDSRGLASETTQRHCLSDEDEIAQAKCMGAAGIKPSFEEDEEDGQPVETSLEEEEMVQGKFSSVRSEEGTDDEEYAIQAKSTSAMQNRTGLPDDLKRGIESLSDRSMDDVKVHYNSAKPAQLNALAYTQGKDIHVGPGQQKHVAHEAWHVVQQAEGRVAPTMQMRGTAINDDSSLEREADVMGARALAGQTAVQRARNNGAASILSGQIVQRKWDSTEVENELVWSEPMNGRVWFFNTESRLMWYGIASESESGEYEDQAGKKNAKPHEEWLKMGWGLTPIQGGGKLIGGAKIVWEKHGEAWSSKGEERYLNMLKGSTISGEEQYARDWFFQNYYKTSQDEGVINSVYKHPPSDIGLDYAGTYRNFTNVKEGTLKADDNYALLYKDKFEGEYFYNPKTGKPEKMSGSEILFQQWREASGGEQSAPLRTLIRSHVAGNGLMMLKAILFGTDKSQKDEPVYTYGDPGFFALLVVPNVTSAIYLVKDHGEELGISGIEAIKVLGNLSLQIYFKMR